MTCLNKSHHTAGGSSNRYSTEKSKLQELINNKSILEHTISAFSNNINYKNHHCISRKNDSDWFNKIKQKLLKRNID